MAWAKAYDAYEDAGLAFSDDELAAFDLRAWQESHLTATLEQLVVLRRRTEIAGLPKEDWWKKATKGWRDQAAWFCRACQLPGIDEASLVVDPRTAAGKSVSAVALGLEAEEWLGFAVGWIDAEMRFFVSLVRRKGDKDRPVRSAANKTANAVMQQRLLLNRLEALLLSMPNQGSKQDADS